MIQRRDEDGHGEEGAQSGRKLRCLGDGRAAEAEARGVDGREFDAELGVATGPHLDLALDDGERGRGRCFWRCDLDADGVVMETGGARVQPGLGSFQQCGE